MIGETPMILVPPPGVPMVQRHHLKITGAALRGSFQVGVS